MVVRILRNAAFLFVSLLWVQMANAQNWVQIEAQPNRASALQRAETYAQNLSDVNAFQTGNNWHVIAIGPFTTENEAQRRLLELRAARSIPSDSFISDGGTFRARIFGTGIAVAATQAEPAIELAPGEESPAEARRGERQLSRQDRELIQTALKCEGFYNSVIDASFGPGTRRAMSGWQQANGYEPTGILTTRQRLELVQGFEDVQNALGIAAYSDAQAGIDVELPLNMVRFDRYESPFVHFQSLENNGIGLALISQSGGSTTLTALFDIMQTLEMVPLGADASLGRQSFTIDGQDTTRATHIFARRAGDTVKGFALTWPADDSRKFRAVLSAMQASFRTTDAVLPDNAGSGAQDINLLSGLDIRRADKTRSGFYVDGDGLVATTADVADDCVQLTLDGDIEAWVVAREAEAGFALLQPAQNLSPLAIARLATNEPRIQSEIAIAGYSFGGLLSAPSVTFGSLADLKGLDGDQNVQRLAVANEPGDAGGPVFDVAGTVLGMVLPPSENARRLPGDVAFAADADTLATFLAANGVEVAGPSKTAAMAAEDLTVLATDLTVLVSCWK